MSRPITFTGLASGVDSGAIVDQLMTIERRPSVALQGSIDAAGARITALAGIQASLNALRAAEQGLRGPGAFAAAPSATSSDPARVAVTATADAVQTSYSVTVEQLARADVVTQGSSLAAAGAADVLHLTGGGSAVDVAVGAGDSIETIASRVNATGGGVAASVVGGKLRLTSTTTGAAAAIAVSSDGSLAADLAFTEHAGRA